MRYGSRWQGHVVIVAGFHDNVQVFVVEFALKAGLEVALDDTRTAHVHHPGLGVATTQHLDDDRRVHASFGTQHQRLGHTYKVEGDLNLVASFHRLASAVGAAKGDGLAQLLKDWHDLVESSFVTADHNGQRGVDSPHLPTADGRVQAADAFFAQLFSHFGGHARRDSAHVNVDLTFPNPFDESIGPQGHGFDIGRVGHHRYDDVAAFGDLFARMCFLRALGHQLLDCTAAPIVHRQRIASLKQVPGHGLAHNPQTNESDSRF